MLGVFTASEASRNTKPSAYKPGRKKNENHHYAIGSGKTKFDNCFKGVEGIYSEPAYEEGG